MSNVWSWKNTKLLFTIVCTVTFYSTFLANNYCNETEISRVINIEFRSNNTNANYNSELAAYLQYAIINNSDGLIES